MCVPVSASSFRRYCTRSVLGSTSARRSTLLTVNVIGTHTHNPLNGVGESGVGSETNDLRPTTHDWLTTRFPFETGEELADDHLRRGLHHAAADTGQSAAHIGITRPVDKGSLAVLGEVDPR